MALYIVHLTSWYVVQLVASLFNNEFEGYNQNNRPAICNFFWVRNVILQKVFLPVCHSAPYKLWLFFPFWSAILQFW